MAQAPDEVGGGLSLFAGRGGRLHRRVLLPRPAEDGERAVAPLRALGPSLDAVRPNEYRAFQAMTDLQHPFGMRARRRRGFLPELSDEAVDALAPRPTRPPRRCRAVMLRPLGAR